MYLWFVYFFNAALADMKKHGVSFTMLLCCPNDPDPKPNEKGNENEKVDHYLWILHQQCYFFMVVRFEFGLNNGWKV